jgi:hypothetical protein
MIGLEAIGKRGICLQSSLAKAKFEPALMLATTSAQTSSATIHLQGVRP